MPTTKGSTAAEKKEKRKKREVRVPAVASVSSLRAPRVAATLSFSPPLRSCSVRSGALALHAGLLSSPGCVCDASQRASSLGGSARRWCVGVGYVRARLISAFFPPGVRVTFGWPQGETCD